MWIQTSVFRYIIESPVKLLVKEPSVERSVRIVVEVVIASGLLVAIKLYKGRK